MNSYNKQKKILFITTTPFYQEKGSTLRIYSMAKILGKDYKIDLVTYSLGKDVSIPNVNIKRTTAFFQPKIEINKISLSKILLDFLVFFKSLGLIIKNKYEIIHCEDFEAALIGRFLIFFSRNKFLVYDLHNRLIDNLELKRKVGRVFKRLISHIEVFIIKRCNLIILNWNKYNKDEIFKNKKTILYYDQINIENLETYPLPEKDYIVYSGNFEPYQGLKEFLEIFNSINLKYNVVLIGEASKEIINLVKEQHQLSNPIIFTGRLSVAQTNYLIKNSIASILPRIEGSSMKVIHYLMLNKPVIAKATLSNEELLSDGYNAFLYDSPEELKDILIDMNNNLDKVKLLEYGVEKSKQTILLNWDTESFLEKYRYGVNY